MQERTLTAAGPGPVTLAVRLPAGVITVRVGTATTATAVITTRDDSGPAADTVAAARLTAGPGTLTVTAPDAAGGAVHSGGGVVIGGSNYGVISTGNRNGTIIINGRVVSSSSGAGPSVSPVVVEADLPAGSSVEVHSASGQTSVTGDAASVTGDTSSGSIDIERARRIDARAASGSIRVGRATGRIMATTMSGSIRVDRYEGSSALLTAMSGSVAVRCTSEASGVLAATTMSGDITITGARNTVDVQTRSSSGHVSVR